MTKRLSASLRRRFAKATNIAALLSMFVSMFTFVGSASPVLAAPSIDPLAYTYVTLAQPILNAASETTQRTNVSVSFKPSADIVIGANDPCIAANDCVALTLIVDDTQSPTYGYEEWADTFNESDITWNGPANSVLFSAATSSQTPDQMMAKEQLVLTIACTAACTFSSATTYSVDIVNSPLIAPAPSSSPAQGVYYTYTHTVKLQSAGVTPANQPIQALQTQVAYGEALTVTASVNAALSFAITGVPVENPFYTDLSNVGSGDNSCDFGTLVPGAAKICLFNLAVTTNAENGYSVYVVQTQNMTFNGIGIKQFTDGTRTDDASATVWASPSAAAFGHLGYSSNDTSVFAPSGGTVAVWAGIPTIAAAGANPVITGLVADSASPGVDSYVYALKVESAATLPQAADSLGQVYTHDEYFLVVGNF
ncbi:hypothetical protein K8R04_01490 [Candidatus Uhrbacteria bacterium]|nr:hypothetical protein [Candidatus Uhrbacteria bacterium]